MYGKVGNGKRIRFWKEKWLGDSSLESQSPLLARISSKEDGCMEEFAENDEELESTNWNFHFRRNLNEPETQELMHLITLLRNISVNKLLEDRRIWLCNSSELFTCKSAFENLITRPGLQKVIWNDSVWSSIVPSKVKIFSWLVLLDRVNVFTIMQKRRPFHSLSPSWCVTCKNNKESVDHLFLQCSFTSLLWRKLTDISNITWSTPPNSSEATLQIPGGRKRSVIWKSAVQSLWWNVWLERNERIFEENEHSVEDLWEKIRFWTAMWLFNS